MNIKLATVAFIGILSVSTSTANFLSELKQIDFLSTTLRNGTVTGLVATATANRLNMPWIPDKWHVANRMKEPDRITVAEAGRAFGIELAKHLETVAPLLQNLPPDDELFAWSKELCVLSEWVSEPDGIGNLLLTGRCLDLASVGLGRLVANTNFPIARCEQLASCVKEIESRIEPQRRSKILDFEIGGKIFAGCRTDDELQRVWEAGVRWNIRGKMLRLKAMGSKISESSFVGDNLVTDELLESHKSFFEKVPLPNPPTCLNRLIKGSNHKKVVVGVGSQVSKKASDLLKFRKVVGYFPEKWVRSEEERIVLEREIALYAKFGAKITPHEADPSFDPLKLAFKSAWDNKNTDKSAPNGYSNAVQAYKEIMSGKFLDSDTDNICKNFKLEKRTHERKAPK